MQIREGMQAQITSLEEELKKPVRKLCYSYVCACMLLTHITVCECLNMLLLTQACSHNTLYFYLHSNIYVYTHM